MTRALPHTEALIPQPVLDAFAGRAELPLRDLARAMGRDIKTLTRQRKAGNLPVHIKGVGVERRHYVCTLKDVAEFYQRTGESACQSSESGTHSSINSTFKLKANDFTAQRAARMNVRPRKSRGRSVLKLSDYSMNPRGPDGGQ
jgi:hypothetical protein